MSKNTSLQDQPIHRDGANITQKDVLKEDSLNNKPYARALAEFIESTDTPMTIGLQGDWGIGKTSMMNMIKGCLTNTYCIQIDFNTWSYSQFKQDEYLALACLEALIGKVESKMSKHKDLKKSESLTDKIKTARDRVRGVISAVSVSVPGVSVNLGEAGDALAGKEQKPYEDLAYQMTIFKDEFSSIINEFYKLQPDKNRVVIFIDDLDRVKPIKALELLEGIKNFIDVEGCVFVLAVDYEVVQSGMAQKLGVDLQKTSGKSFFDKIIQLPFAMPTNNYELDKYIQALLIQIQFERFKDDGAFKTADSEFFHNITISTVGRNPRSIKRVINYADLLNKIRANFRSKEQRVTKLDMQVLYALICMQIAWPELFTYFTRQPNGETIRNLENWEFLDQLPEAKKVLERVPDEDAEKNKIATYFDTLFELLDDNDSGDIDDKEIEPVLKMMRLAKMTSTEIQERTRDYFLKRFNENNKANSDNVASDFLENIFRPSRWFTDNDLDYRKSGKRCVTLVHKRKQVGSLITLQSWKRKFIFRLAMPSKKIIDKISSLQDDSIDLNKCIRPLSERESALTGFGNTIVDYHSMDFDNEIKLDLINQIFSIITGK